MRLSEIIVTRFHRIRFGNQAVVDRNDLVTAISEEPPPALLVVVPAHALAPSQAVRLARNRLHDDLRKIREATLSAKGVSEYIGLHRSLPGKSNVLVVAPTTCTCIAAWRLPSIRVSAQDRDDIRTTDPITDLGHPYSDPLTCYAVANEPGTTFMKGERASLGNIMAEIDLEDIPAMHGDHATAVAMARW